jgi:hypothetical protein
MGFRPRHAPNYRGAEIIATRGVPVHHPADDRKAVVGHNGAALVFDPIEQANDFTAPDFRDGPIAEGGINKSVEELLSLTLGSDDSPPHELI